MQSPIQVPVGGKISGQFLFIVCQAGAEKVLKEEIGREHPELRFSFSRPGFVTFKSQNAPLDEGFELRSVFARAYGLSLGKTSDVAGVLAQAQAWGEPLRLHVFERDQFPPSEEPKGFVAGGWSRKARSAIEAEGSFLEGDQASGSERVFDVVCVEENEWWIGVHRHAAWHCPFPGGHWPIELPADSPSRAYLKLEEALAWGGIPIRAGDQAVEIGSAPGGASYALLKRGVSVVGIDPGEMDPKILRFRVGTRFDHFQAPVADILREDLPASVEWLLADMNVEPRITLAAVDRLGTRMRESLLGIVLTLKLNQWDFAKQIPNWLEYVSAMGMMRVRAKQLSHNRREICVYGLTQKGLARLRARSLASGSAP